jgi:hypothetical protein
MRPFRTILSAARALALLAAAFALAGPGTGLAEGAAAGPAIFDSPEIRATADVVPQALLRGPHWQLGPTVMTFAFMNQYSVTSDYGSFTPASDARLRRLVREIAAIAALQRSIRATLSHRRRSMPGKGWCKGPSS